MILDIITRKNLKYVQNKYYDKHSSTHGCRLQNKLSTKLNIYNKWNYKLLI